MYTYPLTKQKPFKEKRFNYIIKDDYRWLENINTIEVEKWIGAQNTYTQLILDQHVPTKKYPDAIKHYTSKENISPPIFVNEYRFWTKQGKEQQQPVLYYKKYSDSEDAILLDPNILNTQGTTSLDFYFPSPNGTYVAYGLSNAGSSISTLFIIDIHTKTRIFDIIPYAKNTTVCWLADESGFYYTRYPIPSTVKQRGDENYFQKVYFHTLKTSHQHDVYIFGEGLSKDTTLSLLLSENNQYLYIKLTKGHLIDELYQYDTITRQIAPVIKETPIRFDWYIEKDTLYLATDYQNQQREIVSTKIGQIPSSLEAWKQCIAATDAKIAKFIVMNGNYIVVYEKENTHAIGIYSTTGDIQDSPTIKEKTTIDTITTDAITNTFYYACHSYTAKQEIYKYQIEQHEQTLIHKSPISIPEESLYIDQKESLTIIHKKYIQQDNQRPVLLFVTTDIMPSYLGAWMPFIEQGGIVMILPITVSAKDPHATTNTIITACIYARTAGYTNADKLILCAKNLAATFSLAAIEKRPDVCKALICFNPITDLIHNPLFYIGEGAQYTGLLGSPMQEDEIATIFSYSPYHNLKTWSEYPAVLFTVGFTNHITSPANTYKLGALMQKQNTQNPIFIHTNLQAGNILEDSLSIQDQLYALEFIDWQLNLS